MVAETPSSLGGDALVAELLGVGLGLESEVVVSTGGPVGNVVNDEVG